MPYIERVNADIVQSVDRWVAENPDKTDHKRFWEHVMTKYGSVALFCYVVRTTAKQRDFDPLEWCEHATGEA